MLGKFTTAGRGSDGMRRISALEAIKFLLMTCDSMMPEDGDLRCHEKGIESWVHSAESSGCVWPDCSILVTTFLYSVSEALEWVSIESRDLDRPGESGDLKEVDANGCWVVRLRRAESRFAELDELLGK
jgi:hypothetical protein